MIIRKNLIKTLVLGIFVSTLFFTPGSVEAKVKHKAGDLLKIRGIKGAAVYQIGEDGKKYIYPDQKTFNTWHDDFDDVEEVELEDLDDFDDGGTVTFQAGTRLITHPNTAKVYAVGDDGELTYIPDESTARKFYGNKWTTIVEDIDPGVFSISYKVNKKKLTEDTLPEGSLIEEEDTGNYFLIENGQRRRVLKEILKLQKLLKKNIIKLNRLSNSYDDGDDVGDDEDEDNNFGKHKVVVCHRPDKANRTIKVSSRALRAHLAHGDVKGRCIGDDNDGDDNDGDNNNDDDGDDNDGDNNNDDDGDDNDGDDNDDSVLPDITVSNIMVDPASPVANTTTTPTTITVYIKNNGTISLTDTAGILNGLASFEDFTSTASSTTPVISETEPFDPDETVTIVWTGYFTSAGEKTLDMTADESDELEESDETNNTYSETVTILEETV